MPFGFRVLCNIGASCHIFLIDWDSLLPFDWNNEALLEKSSSNSIWDLSVAWVRE